MYFAPTHNGTERHGEVLRLDTAGAFGDAFSWLTFDPGVNGLGDDPDGYQGAVFDGHYVYFVPYHNGSRMHSEVLRLDTDGDFSSISSWDTFDPLAHGAGSGSGGYYDAAFDGRYVYFAPTASTSSGRNCEVLRLDTTGDFSDVLSWDAYDPGAKGGYKGVIFDGQHVYFVPWHDGSGGFHGEVLRLDTSGGFADNESWQTFDPGLAGLGNQPEGYRGGVFDGRFIYFAPYENSAGQHGEVCASTPSPISRTSCPGPRSIREATGSEPTPTATRARCSTDGMCISCRLTTEPVFIARCSATTLPAVHKGTASFCSLGAVPLRNRPLLMFMANCLQVEGGRNFEEEGFLGLGSGVKRKPHGY